MKKRGTTEKAIFAAGCFWGIEEAFRKVPGVTDVRVGYTGGHIEKPTYKQVCGGDTGHAEAVEVTFNPEQTSYKKLLEIFWSIHDATQVNRQGPDVGTQYRSAIFYYNEEQKRAAESSKNKQEKEGKVIATEITGAPDFWEAEKYHQQYFAKQRD